MPRAPPVTTATLPLSERGDLDMPSIMATDHEPIAQIELCPFEQVGVAARPGPVLDLARQAAQARSRAAGSSWASEEMACWASGTRYSAGRRQ